MTVALIVIVWTLCGLIAAELFGALVDRMNPPEE